MAEKKGKVAAAEEKSEPKFTKRQVLASARYENRKDLVSALLRDDREYTMTEVNRLVDQTMKGQVK